MDYMHFYKQEDIDKLFQEMKDGKLSINEAVKCLGHYMHPNGFPVYLGIGVTTTAGTGCVCIVPIEYNRTI